MKEERSSFSGKLGFILAAAGSAVGLGNLWRFPYLAAQHGGGIFIFVYVILVLTFGFSMLIMELAIGRKTKQSSITAYSKLHKKFGFLGYLAAIVPIIILPYYCVIGGWVTKYMVEFITGGGLATAGNTYFGDFTAKVGEPLIFFVIYILATMAIVLGGVQKGVERVSKILMPVLLLLSLVICVYVATIDGAWDGIKYYLLPDFSNFSMSTVCAAMGQLFFSLSIAMGIMVSYGSYVKDDINLSGCVNQIEIFDTSVALLSGLMIVPAVFVFAPDKLNTSGPGLMFETLPLVFKEMPAGQVIGAIFFVLVFLAALTSSISIMEAIVSMVMDKFKTKRWTAVIGVTACSILLGIPSAWGFGLWGDVKILGMDFLTFFDFLANSVLMPIVALVTCILVGWVVKTKTIEDEITKNGEKFARAGVFRVMVRYIAPVFLIMILVFYTLAQFGLVKY